MNAVLNWIKGEPALVAAFVGIIATLSASIPTQQGTLGLIVSAVQLLLATIVRQNVTPTAGLPKPAA